METTYKLKFYKLKSSGLSSFYDTNNWGKFEENLRGMGDMVWMIWHGITLKAKLWIHLDMTKVHHLKGLTSPYIVSYLHFLNLNNSLTLPKLLSLLKLVLIWCLPCFLPARFTWMSASLRNQNKYKPFILFQKHMLQTHFKKTVIE